MRKNSGFTLFEMLVVITIFGIIAIVSSGIFFSVLKGASKTNITNLVKQEGTFALAVMERMIRNSRGIVGDCTIPMVSADGITITNPDEGETTFICTDVDSEISSNSASLISNLVKVDSCVINCVSGQGINPDVVEITFTLSQGSDTTEKEDIAEVEFSKKITLRNID